MHTEGKWESTSTVKTPNGLDELVSVGGSPVAWAYNKEDALLIASAPALLEALEGMVSMYCDLVNSGDAGFWNPEENDDVIKARAAIASAKGKE